MVFPPYDYEPDRKRKKRTKNQRHNFRQWEKAFARWDTQPVAVRSAPTGGIL